MEILASKTIEYEGFTFTLEFVDYHQGALWSFEEQWELTDTHEGGVTITNPDGSRNSWKYAIPKQYSLAELAKDYAAQGRENPSREAYQSLQKQLERDSEASDCSLLISAKKGSIQLFEDEHVISTDYHWTDYDYDHDKALEYLAGDYLDIDEWHKRASKEFVEIEKEISPGIRIDLEAVAEKMDKHQIGGYWDEERVLVAVLEELYSLNSEVKKALKSIRDNKK